MKDWLRSLGARWISIRRSREYPRLRFSLAGHDYEMPMPNTRALRVTLWRIEAVIGRHERDNQIFGRRLKQGELEMESKLFTVTVYHGEGETAETDEDLFLLKLADWSCDHPTNRIFVERYTPDRQDRLDQQWKIEAGKIDVA